MSILGLGGAPTLAFKRELHDGELGQDVVAVKRALWRAGLLWRGPGGFSAVWGPAAQAALKKLQRGRALPLTGIYTRVEHEILRTRHAEGKPREWCFDRFACKAYRGFTVVTREEQRRQDIVDVWAYWRSQAAAIGYSQKRLYETGRPVPAWKPVTFDCSALFGGGYYVVGAPDPAGFPFPGAGSTREMCVRGASVKRGNLKAADAVFYGRDYLGRPTHVAGYVGGGKIISHGSAIGPLLLDIDYRSDLWGMRTYEVLR